MLKNNQPAETSSLQTGKHLLYLLFLQNRFPQSEISVIDHTASRLQDALSSECDRRVQAAVCARSGNGCKLMF